VKLIGFIIIAVITLLSATSIILFTFTFTDSKFNTLSNKFKSAFGDAQPSKTTSFVGKVMVCLTILGTVIVTGGGIYSALFFLPSSWGRLDDYGDFQSYRFVIASILGVFLSIHVLSKLEDLWQTHSQHRIDKIIAKLAEKKIPRAEALVYFEEKILNLVFNHADKDVQKRDFIKPQLNIYEVTKTECFYYLNKSDQSLVEDYLVAHRIY